MIVETLGIVAITVGLGQGVLRLRNCITFLMDLVHIESSYHLLVALESCLRAQMVLMSFHALAYSWVHSDFEFVTLGINLKTLLLLNMVSKVIVYYWSIGGDLAEILRILLLMLLLNSIETLP